MWYRGRYQIPVSVSVHPYFKQYITHTLEYRYTMVTLGSRFTSVGLLDGEEFMYYDIKTAKMTPNTEWIKEVETDSYWQEERQDVQQDWLKGKLQDLNSFNQGGDTLQRVYGCEIDDNGVTRGYDESIYNGKHFISLDLNTGIWTAVDERAKSFTGRWNPERKSADSWKRFLEGTCVDRLKRCKSYSTKKEEPGGSDGRSDGRSDGGSKGGSDGGKTAVTVLVVVLVLAAVVVVGVVIYKKKLCDQEQKII